MVDAVDCPLPSNFNQSHSRVVVTNPTGLTSRTDEGRWPTRGTEWRVLNSQSACFIWRCVSAVFRYNLPSVLWCCWLGGRKGILPVKTEWWGTGVVICLGWGADLHMAQLMPLPLTVSCFSKIQIGFTFLVLAHLGNPRQNPEGHKWL